MHHKPSNKKITNIIKTDKNKNMEAKQKNNNQIIKTCIYFLMKKK